MLKDHIRFGRKIYSLDNGGMILKSISITKKALPDEDEKSFARRLVKEYQDQQGVIEIVFKHGRPDYAIITFS